MGYTPSELAEDQVLYHVLVEAAARFQVHTSYSILCNFICLVAIIYSLAYLVTLGYCMYMSRYRAH
jgi:hypothetical protein